MAAEPVPCHCQCLWLTSSKRYTTSTRNENHAIETTYAAKPVVPLSQSQSRFYVRLKAKDQPGVFGSVATAFGNAQVSLDMILQTRREVNLAEIVLVTHEVVEQNFYLALERIKQIDSIRNISNVIRVLERG